MRALLRVSSGCGFRPAEIAGPVTQIGNPALADVSHRADARAQRRVSDKHQLLLKNIHGEHQYMSCEPGRDAAKWITDEPDQNWRQPIWRT